MGVAVQLRHLARQHDAACGVAFQFKLLAGHGHDLTGQKAVFLRLQRAGEGLRGKGIHVFARNAVFLGQVLGRLDHGHRACGVDQRFHQEVLELHGRAQLEAGAVCVGRNRVARHGLGAHHQRHVGVAQRDLVGCLAKQLKARAADALHQDGGHIQGNARVQTDVARQHKGVEIGLRHGAGDDRAHIGGGHAAARQHGARDLDAHVGGRYMAQRAAVIDHGRAHAVHQPGVQGGREKVFCSGHGQALEVVLLSVTRSTVA